MESMLEILHSQIHINKQWPIAYMSVLWLVHAHTTENVTSENCTQTNFIIQYYEQVGPHSVYHA